MALTPHEAIKRDQLRSQQGPRSNDTPAFYLPVHPVKSMEQNKRKMRTDQSYNAELLSIDHGPRQINRKWHKPWSKGHFGNTICAQQWSFSGPLRALQWHTLSNSYHDDKIDICIPRNHFIKKTFEFQLNSVRFFSLSLYISCSSLVIWRQVSDWGLYELLIMWPARTGRIPYLSESQWVEQYGAVHGSGVDHQTNS